MAIPNWLTLSQTAGTGNATVTVTASSYSELVERSAALIISGQNASTNLTITQEAFIPYFNLSPSELTFTFTASSATVTVETNFPWSASSSDGWITLNPSSGISGQTTITVSVPNYQSYWSRNGVVTFYDMGGNVAGTLPVAQNRNMDFSSGYVMCTYETTEPNEEIRLFGALRSHSFGDYTAYYSSIGGASRWYMPDIYFPDGEYIGPEHQDVWRVPSVGTHAAYFRFPNDTISYNDSAGYYCVGDDCSWKGQFPWAHNGWIRTVSIPSEVTNEVVNLFGDTNITSISTESDTINFTAAGVTTLSSVTMNNATTICDSAFAGCTNLRLSSSVLANFTSIGASAFAGCTSLNLNNLEFSGTTIGHNAFDGSSISGGLSFTSCTIDGGAFANCPELWGTVYMSGCSLGRASVGVYNYGGVFQNSTGLDDYQIYSCEGWTESLAGCVGSVYIDNSDIPIARYIESVSHIDYTPLFTKVVFGPSQTLHSYYAQYSFPYFIPTVEEFVWYNPDPTILGYGINFPHDFFAYSSALTKMAVYQNPAAGMESGLTFNGVGLNGTLYYPSGADYSEWMLTTDNRLGQYGWTSAILGSIDYNGGNIPASGGTVRISIISTEPWTLEVNAPSTTYDISGTSTATTVSASIPSNDSEPKYVYFNLKHNGVTIDSISVLQEGVNYIVYDGGWIDSEGETIEVEVHSNTTWELGTVVGSTSLPSIFGTSGISTEHIVVPANSGSTDRDVTMTLYINGGEAHIVTVKQHAGVYTYLTILFKESGTLSVTGSWYTYKINDGEWIDNKLPNTGPPIDVERGDEVYLRNCLSSEGPWVITSSAEHDLRGNAYSLRFINFSGITTLTAATNVTFTDDTGLVHADKLQLPASTLYEHAYNAMFSGCTNLVSAPSLPATSLKNYCYYRMFRNCSSLTTSPDLTAYIDNTLSNCMSYMFQGCSSLNQIRCTSSRGGSTRNTKSWVDGVAATGTFTKASGVTWPSGVNGIPDGWTVVEE